MPLPCFCRCGGWTTGDKADSRGIQTEAAVQAITSWEPALLHVRAPLQIILHWNELFTCNLYLRQLSGWHSRSSSPQTNPEEPTEAGRKRGF